MSKDKAAAVSEASKNAADRKKLAKAAAPVAGNAPAKTATAATKATKLAQVPGPWGIDNHPYKARVDHINVRDMQAGQDTMQVIDLKFAFSAKTEDLKQSIIFDDLYRSSLEVLQLEQDQVIARDASVIRYDIKNRACTVVIVFADGSERKIWCRNGLVLVDVELTKNKSQPNPLVDITISARGCDYADGEGLLKKELLIAFVSKSGEQLQAEAVLEDAAKPKPEKKPGRKRKGDDGDEE